MGGHRVVLIGVGDADRVCARLAASTTCPARSMAAMFDHSSTTFLDTGGNPGRCNVSMYSPARAVVTFIA
jgi:hypothetical protein